MYMNNRREEYVNGVIGYLVEDTIIDFKENKIYFSFYSPSFSSPQIISPSLLQALSIRTYPPSTFFRYCEDTYGITDEEIEYVWGEYRTIIKDKINSGGSINESVDKKKDYLDKVIGYLVDDTKIETKVTAVTFPFSLPTYTYIPYRWFTWKAPLGIFLDYFMDTYGLTYDEADYVWDGYRKIIKDKINNIRSINESVDRRSEYLDKVLGYLVDDTEIDYGNKTIKYPFLPLSLSSLPLSPSLTFLPFSSTFSTYCKDTYGLTEKEISYVWRKYINSINDKINNIRSINESNNILTRREYLDKVVEYMLEDTEINLNTDRIYDYGRWSPPFQSEHDGYPALPDFALNDNHVIEFPLFASYGNTTYGLTDEDEINYVWGKYTSNLRSIFKMDDYGKINESVDRRSEYLDKVLGYLMDDTEISNVEEDRSFRPPTTSVWFHPTYLEKGYDKGDQPTLDRSFITYCKDTYGLTNSEIKGVWGKYKKNILNIFKSPVNESVELFIDNLGDRRKLYVNRIIEFLLQDTIIDYEEKKITYPFFFAPAFIPDHLPFSLPDFHYITKYCRDTYGLTGEEIIYVWEKYKAVILDKVNTRGSINESMDIRKEYYLGKIVDYLIEDTEIDYNAGIITFPFSSIGPSGKLLPSFLLDLNSYLGWGMSSSFHIYCRGTYGLSKDEIQYAWDKFKVAIKDEYNKGAMNHDDWRQL